MSHMINTSTDARELFEHLQGVETACQQVQTIWCLSDEAEDSNATLAFSDFQQVRLARIAIVDLLRKASATEGIELPDISVDDRKWGITDFTYANTLHGYFPLQAP